MMNKDILFERKVADLHWLYDTLTVKSTPHPLTVQELVKAKHSVIVG